MTGLHLYLEKVWYSKNFLSVFLLPLSWLFMGIVVARRGFYRVYHYKRRPPSVFILVVGNLTVGGTGKTPLLIWIANRCVHHGLKVGIITRGYKKRHAGKTIEVRPHSLPEEVGDEALLLAQKTSCPVIAAADRMQAVRLLVRTYRPDVILSDDGLQHYKLPRDIEIAVVDGVRQFGNGRCLPSGPLREPLSRMHACDLVISNGYNDDYEYCFETVPEDVVPLDSSAECRSLLEFRGTTVHAVAGLGNPVRFFNMLEDAGIHIIKHVFPDHHAYVEDDLDFGDHEPILMTEKDAVKCKPFVDRNIWYLPIIVQPNPVLEQRITTLIQEIPHA